MTETSLEQEIHTSRESVMKKRHCFGMAKSVRGENIGFEPKYIVQFVNFLNTSLLDTAHNYLVGCIILKRKDN